MKALQYIACGFTIALAATEPAQAGLTPADSAGVRVERSANSAHPHGFNGVALDAESISAPISLDPLPSRPMHADAVPLARAEVRELPPAPDSTALFLCALGSLGTWQLGRSARKMHFGAAPDWYHTGGPTQIGHATPFDLDYGAVALCRFDEPTDGRPVGRPDRHEGRRALEAQSRAGTYTPRAPPSSF